jgi:hydroxymethylpyrimidine pyrophosphatase-like HAD family hydrolase
MWRVLSARRQLLMDDYGTRVALRCLYTDLDGTLLGLHGSLFRDADGGFSKAQARMLEACHRAEVEVVIMSGRREAQVMSDARLLGQSSYIYEAGCAMVIDRERTLLTGEWQPTEERTVAERIVDSGVADLLLDRFEGRLEWHSPWHTGRELSLLMRGKIDVGEANATIADAGHDDLRFLDNGAIVRTMPGIEVAHAYHLVPGGASKASSVDAHRRARGYAREECIAAGDSLEDLDAAPHVSRFFCVANGPERDAMLREQLGAHPNVTVTEGRNGDGVYEAVVSTLAGAG